MARSVSVSSALLSQWMKTRKSSSKFIYAAFDEIRLMVSDNQNGMFHIRQFLFFGSRLNLYITRNMAYLLDHIIICLGLSLGVDVVTYVGQLVKDVETV